MARVKVEFERNQIRSLYQFLNNGPMIVMAFINSNETKSLCRPQCCFSFVRFTREKIDVLFPNKKAQSSPSQELIALTNRLYQKNI
jgi:hypothetical protein